MFFNNNKFFAQGGCCCQDNCHEQCPCQPVIEPTIERCVTKDICHTVEHICPIHTRIINNHIIQHNYTPEYTCSEENIVTNVDPGCCNNF